jgi:glycosyltransferase involved in cell wall biosynthesis
MKNNVSVIIPALNEEKYIGKCLEALSCIDSLNIDYEIIIVDNGSKDRTVEIAKSFNAKVLIKKDVHIAALRNFGAVSAKGNILAFIDADCTVSRKWLISALNCMKRENADAVGSFHKVPEDSGWIGKTSEVISKGKIGKDINYLPSGNMIIKKDCFCALNGFDESLETNEDLDLCYRLKRGGYKIFADPSIEAIHLGIPRSLREFVGREIWHGESAFKVFIDDLKKVKNMRVVPYAIFFALLIINVPLGFLLLVLNQNGMYFFIVLSFCFLIVVVTTTIIRVGVNRRKIFFSIFLYNILYGLGRGLSLWMLLYYELRKKLFNYKRSSTSWRNKL